MQGKDNHWVQELKRGHAVRRTRTEERYTCSPSEGLSKQPPVGLGPHFQKSCPKASSPKKLTGISSSSWSSPSWLITILYTSHPRLQPHGLHPSRLFPLPPAAHQYQSKAYGGVGKSWGEKSLPSKQNKETHKTQQPKTQTKKTT